MPSRTYQVYSRFVRCSRASGGPEDLERLGLVQDVVVQDLLVDVPLRQRLLHERIEIARGGLLVWLLRGQARGRGADDERESADARGYASKEHVTSGRSLRGWHY